MTEFIEKLCAALSVAGSPALVEKNRVYYTEYFEGEISKGRSESEVLEELGAPELIANSILEANGYQDRFVDDDRKTYNAYDTPDGDPTTFAQGMEYRGKGGEHSRADGSGVVGDDDSTAKKGMSLKTKLIIAGIIAILILFGIMALLIVVVGGIFRWLGPIIIPVLVVWIIYKLVFSNKS